MAVILGYRCKNTSGYSVLLRRCWGCNCEPVVEGGPPHFSEYAGFTYEQASREAERLIQTRGWFKSFDLLTALRNIMIQQKKEG